MQTQTARFDRLRRSFERFYALNVLESGNDWVAYDVPIANLFAPAMSTCIDSFAIRRRKSEE